jgi:hypothetical protein
MQYKKLGLFFYTLLFASLAHGQEKAENVFFESPVDFPIYLSGNFGEIRSTHFHSGIDIKTQGLIGKRISAVDNGYISRIKVSVNSYGKTIYISHPNGYTTVYGHLSKFNSKIEKRVKDIQYQNNEYEINYFPDPKEFPVQKGDLIGFSGNTGSSEGPHLHFEVRETSYQIPVNPLFFNFKIIDNIPPVLYSLFIYPIDKCSSINHKKGFQDFKLKKNKGNYIINDTSALILSGSIGFGLEMNDYLNGSNNKCGIYSLSLLINDDLRYNHTLDKFSFSEAAYVKSHIDYAEKARSKKTIQKTFIAPNNNLSIYKSHQNRGIYNFDKDTSYSITLIAKDAYGNESRLSFKAMGQTLTMYNEIIQDSIRGQLMNWEQENQFESDEIKIVIPEKALFDSIYFKYSVSQTEFRAYSNLHHIHNIYTPLNKSYSIALKTIDLPNELSDKAFIAELSEEKINSIDGEIINGYIVAEAKNFGDYVVLIDTTAPEVSPLTNFENINDPEIKFLIKDDLSGIKSYNGYIDNNWALFEYDQKNDLLFYIIDIEKIEKNKEHELELFVIDNKNNVSTYYTRFYW